MVTTEKHRGMILAAGQGSRLRPLTLRHPKPLTNVGQSTILDRALGAFSSVGVNDVKLVTGYMHSEFENRGYKTLFNSQHLNDNILGSVYAGSEQWSEGAICSYGDIVFQESVMRELAETSCDVGVVVDESWRDAYHGRTQHPISEAELAVVDANGKIKSMGKGLDPTESFGEFIGMWKISSSSAPEIASRLHRMISEDPMWRTSYLTRFLTLLAEEDWTITAVPCRGLWREVDTMQDLERANLIFR